MMHTSWSHNRNLYGLFNTRRYTLVHGFCFFRLFFSGGKELINPLNAEPNFWDTMYISNDACQLLLMHWLTHGKLITGYFVFNHDKSLPNQINSLKHVLYLIKVKFLDLAKYYAFSGKRVNYFASFYRKLRSSEPSQLLIILCFGYLGIYVMYICCILLNGHPGSVCGLGSHTALLHAGHVHPHGSWGRQPLQQTGSSVLQGGKHCD